MADQPNWFANDLGAIPARVLDELECAGVAAGRPLVAVDADEVLVHFAEHFGPWLEGLGYRFRLTEYKLDTSISDSAGAPVARPDIRELIWRFIEEETRSQPAIDGAAEALSRISREAQVVVLTNAPIAARACRVANLLGHGMDYPVVMNEGGKGRALSWLAARAAAPVAFVDDSVEQHGSAASHAGEVTRLHLVGSDMLRGIIGRADKADHHPESWREAEETLRRALAL